MFERSPQGFLQAQQQRHHDAAAGGQQAIVGHRQAAEQEGGEHRHFAGHALVAVALQVAHIAGHREQGDGDQHADPDCRAEMRRQQRGESAEQADQ
ncbi:hypothetical protein FQZ97_1112050 [compost metagenome]